MFIAYVNQTDNGCDYTIDCGKTLWELKAATYDEAIIELKQRVIGNFNPEYGYEEGYRGENFLESIGLYETKDFMETIPLWLWYQEAKEYEKKFQEEERERMEREKYEALKEKFEGK